MKYIFEDLLLDGGGADVSALLVDGGERIVPLSTAGEVVSSVVVVDRVDGYGIAAIGRPHLTAAITTTRREHALINGLSPSDYFVVQVPHMYRVYLGYERGDGVELAPAIVRTASGGGGVAPADAPGAVRSTSDLVGELVESALDFPSALTDDPVT